MILFSVVIGVIQGLQYFTQAYVAANVAQGEASQAGDVSGISLGYPEDSTLFYPVLLYSRRSARRSTWATRPSMAMLLLGVSFAVTLVIVLNSRRFVHYQGAVR